MLINLVWTLKMGTPHVVLVCEDKSLGLVDGLKYQTHWYKITWSRLVRGGPNFFLVTLRYIRYRSPKNLLLQQINKYFQKYINKNGYRIPTEKFRLVTKTQLQSPKDCIVWRFRVDQIHRIVVVSSISLILYHSLWESSFILCIIKLFLIILLDLGHLKGL